MSWTTDWQDPFDYFRDCLAKLSEKIYASLAFCLQTHTDKGSCSHVATRLVMKSYAEFWQQLMYMYMYVLTSAKRYCEIHYNIQYEYSSRPATISA